MFDFIKNKIKQKKEKEFLEKRRKVQRSMCWQELEKRDRDSHRGYLLGYISEEYSYLGKKYDYLKYHINLSGNIILSNNDYDIIFCCYEYHELIKFFSDLYFGKLAEI